MLILGKCYELEELNKVIPYQVSNRNLVPIVCIDDQGMQYDQILINHGFNLRVLTDITDIRAVSDYPIVICDIKGIGKSFGSKFEGGHIIEEIHKNYPAKILISFSGNQFDARYNKFFKLCDYVLTKDIDSDQWVSVLDDTIKKVTTPIAQWKRMRAFLYEKNVSTRKVFELEQEFITAIITKDKSKFATNKTLDNLSQDTRTVLTGFLSSLLFKLVIG
ncbi:hypothetical protein [Raoultella ornithinolytica]|uniref:hypothetical protein n=1 Tax=Raoultella ornithinolytica TaxID=54291 RepID=UPI001E3E63D7|nr:hypothetical protein [Raoultella ornithinolytica]MCC2036727.1 hypothetical protein [Raoultella ornithinolytica]MCC2041018.1 hypothetical protein [Raoultella ornithinolytica]MCC2045993.1 hypothetical protein [Raoultella ornithinolytica]MCC2051580.1 hypothetical protein [Raoultella ornithinolytica]MCC2057395.1 hypothetical protein [Raoultella ornithinolytica]